MKYLLNVDKRLRLQEVEKLCAFPVVTKFQGDFTEESVGSFCSRLMDVENQAIDAEQDIIPISIDSYGGDVYALLNLIDTIEDLKTRFTVATILEGKACSAGAVFFTCGTQGHRYMGKNATFMVHNAFGGAHGSPQDIKIAAKEIERQNDKILDIMSANCQKNKDFFRNLIHENKHADLYLSSEECKDYGITNHVGLPRFEVNVLMDFKFKL